ncbi:MAG: hypothetical protein WCK34_06185 [Bacteroidota bacterium]
MQNSPGGGRYLELAPDQLKILGFELSPDGLFYKNIRHGLPGKGIMCLYFTGKTYSSSIMLHEGEEISGHSAPERFLKKEKLTSFDFYPVVVANYSGSHTLDMLAAEKDPKMKLLPVQVNMATLKLGSRSDTLVFWFKPTASLSEALYPVAKIDGYLQVCPPDPHRSK